LNYITTPNTLLKQHWSDVCSTHTAAVLMWTSVHHPDGVHRPDGVHVELGETYD